MKMGSGDQSNNNRAEEVRRRRTQRSQERVSTATNRVVNPVQSRPVTVRGNTFGTLDLPPGRDKSPAAVLPDHGSDGGHRDAPACPSQHSTGVAAGFLALL